MSMMEIGVLLVQYSALEKNQKEAFLCKHPELKDKGVITWALTAARLRAGIGDIKAAARYAGAAFDLAAELGDKQLGAEAADILAEAAGQTGYEQFANEWMAIAMMLRASR